MPAFQNLCGKVDVSTTENSQLENLIFTLDLGRGTQKAYVQCGLPGERLAICGRCETEPNAEIMKLLRPFLAEKRHTQWHEKWHKARIGEADFLELQALGWVGKEETPESFKAAHGLGGNGSGEDFLFMHRLMIKMNQLELSAAGLPCIAPWKNPPDLEDKSWPLPRLVEASQRERDEYMLDGFRTALEKYRNPAKLKMLTLNKLGAIIEPSFHQNMHNFYRSAPACSADAKSQGFCDDLVPVNTSPLNERFWKIHGMLDLLVGDWLKANGYSEIAVDCQGRSGCYTWKSHWVGKTPGR